MGGSPPTAARTRGAWQRGSEVPARDGLFVGDDGVLTQWRNRHLDDDGLERDIPRKTRETQ